MLTPTDGQNLFKPTTRPDLHDLGRELTHNVFLERWKYLLKVADSVASGRTLPPMVIKYSTDTDLIISQINMESYRPYS